ncbi:ADP-ribosyltransferase exoenzyme, partial [Lachnotalea glycerini]
LATMTGAAVGMLTYGGMTKYDSVKNVSGYYKKSEYQTVLSKVVDKDLAETGIKGGSKTISTLGDLSQEQINAIVKYTGDDYANINNSLRGLETVTPENQATINVMKSALDNASLPEDMVLYRGTSTEELGNLKNLAPEELVGEKFVESGFTSTSIDSAVASGTFSGNLQITNDAPSGAHALDISFVSQYSNEAEILFNAGQEMLITSAESKKGILYITVIAE